MLRITMALVCAGGVWLSAGNAWSDEAADRQAAVQDLYSFFVDAMQQGDFGKARALCQKIISLEPRNGIHFYNLACVEARSNNTDAAITALKQSLALGLADPDKLQQDPDLASIRRHPLFGDLTERAARNARGELPPAPPATPATPGYVPRLVPAAPAAPGYVPPAAPAAPAAPSYDNLLVPPAPAAPGYTPPAAPAAPAAPGYVPPPAVPAAPAAPSYDNLLVPPAPAAPGYTPAAPAAPSYVPPPAVPSAPSAPSYVPPPAAPGYVPPQAPPVSSDTPAAPGQDDAIPQAQWTAQGPVGAFFMTRYWSYTQTLEKAAWFFAPGGRVYRDLTSGLTPADLAAHRGPQGTFQLVGDKLIVRWSDGKTAESAVERDTANAQTFMWDMGIFSPITPFANTQALAGHYDGGEAVGGGDRTRVASLQTLDLKSDGSFAREGVGAIRGSTDQVNFSGGTSSATSGTWTLSGYSIVIDGGVRLLAFPFDDDQTPQKPDYVFIGGVMFKKR